MKRIVVASLLLMLVGCAPAEIKTSTPFAEPSVSASAAATEDLATVTGEPRKITVEDFKATQSAAIESNQATQAAITPTPTSATVSEVEPTIIDTAAADILNAGVLPDGAVAQIPAVGHPSAGELAKLGERYAVISDGRSMRVYEVAGGSMLWAVRFGDDATVKHSPDERWIVATIRNSDYINHYYIWETATGTLVNNFEGSDDDVITSWRSDSKLLLIRKGGNGQRGMEFALIDPQTNQDIYTIESVGSYYGDFTHVLWTGDGKYLIIAERDIAIYDAATGALLRELDYEAYGNGMANLYLNADETMLAATYAVWGGDTCSVSGKTVLWNIETGEMIHELAYPSMTDARFSPDGSKIAVSGMTHCADEPTPILTIWDTASGGISAQIPFPEPADPWWLEGAWWSPNGALIAALAGDRIMIFDVLRGEYLRTLDGIADRIEWSADGEKVRSSTHQWNLVTGEITRLDGAPITDLGGLVDMVWLPDGSGVVIAGRQAIQVWAIDPAVVGSTYYLRSIRLSELGVPTNRWDGVNAIAISPDGGTLATAQHGAVVLWDVESGSLRRILVGLEEGIADYQQEEYLDVTWSPDGRWVGASGPSTRIWDAASGEQINEVLTGSRVVGFSPDNTLLAHASKSYHYFDLQTYEDISLSIVGMANAIAWSSDSRRAAFGGGTRDESPFNITIWDVFSGTQTILKGQPYPVTGLAWLPDQRYLLSSGGQEHGSESVYTNVGAGSLILWDTQTAQLVRVFYGHTDEVQAVAVSPDGTLFASASADGTVLIWDVP